LQFYTPETPIKRSDVYRLWLRDKYQSDVKAIKLAFIFGSVARHDGVYGDCDLMICSYEGPGTRAWTSLRGCNDINKEKFESLFGIKLSVLLLTQQEYEEDIDILNRIKIAPRVNVY